MVAPGEQRTSQRQQQVFHSQTETTTTQQNQQVPQAILRLRGRHPPGRSVQWAEGVVDNEGLGRKKSKVCCIYHRPRGVDESSDESSSCSSSDSDTDDNSRRDQHKNHGNCPGHGRRDKAGKQEGDKGKDRRPPSPNAYEKMPKPTAPKDTSGRDSKAYNEKA